MTLSIPTQSFKPRKRVAVFASYSSNGFLPPQVLPYLAGLKPLTTAIIVVCDNDLAPGEHDKLKPYASHVVIGRHGEYDFGSYKRGVAWARKNGLLDNADDLILCNDSCYGPVGSFEPMFQTMQARDLDFWGATDSHEFTYHLQSYWVVLSRPVFLSDAFRNFLEGVKKEENVQKVIMNYELGLTKSLLAAGFAAGAMVPNTLAGVHEKDPSYNNLTLFPIYTLGKGLPLVKVKALRTAHTNADGQNRLLAWLKENAPETYDIAISDLDIRRFEDAGDIGFSLIMPTQNRAWCISQAIRSVVDQTHRNFELIIVDDGSTDQTYDLVRNDFEAEILAGHIRYVRLPEAVGVCNARNIGLSYARKPWIGYVDSDNTVRSYYLTMMANAIVQHRSCQAFFGRIVNKTTGGTIGRMFSRKDILEANYIDLGVFIHHRKLVSLYGGFDPELRRLVDWDLIIRYSADKNPIFVPRIFLEYEDRQEEDRISVRESFISSKIAVHTKYAVKPTVTTAIVSYNHQEFLVEAIESALAQKGNLTHEILISDDGSTDGSQGIISRYAQKYPHNIRNISRGGNFGISDNYRHCFREAGGKFVAVLEGDDYWTDDFKILQQAEFLKKHEDAAMVFSKIRVLDMSKNTRRLLKRQEGLRPLLTGADFARNEHLNLIANLSSAMFRRDLMRNMPSAVYQPRLNEITLSFYMDHVGKIGFIDKVMSIYRQNSASVWTGASQISQLQQAIAIRNNALHIAKPEHRSSILQRLEQKIEQLKGLTAEGKAA